MTNRNPLKDVKCECCGAPAIGVASTSIPYSAAYCQSCAEAGYDPYWVLVSNTAMCNGLENTNEEWQKHVKIGLVFYDKSLDQFNTEVQTAISDMETM